MVDGNKPIPPKTKKSTSSSTGSKASKRKRILSPQSLFDYKALESYLATNDSLSKHRNIIWHHMIRKGNKQKTFDEIPDIPKQIKQKLNADYVICTSHVIQEKQTDTGCKMVIKLQDGRLIETVVIHHSTSHNTRYTTVCVSSQVGCKMSCSFCETGTMGFLANLTCAEIMEQVYHAKLRFPDSVRNVVFMGMGEPLDNYDAVIQSVHGMHDSNCFEMAYSRMTISTVGVTHNIRKLGVDCPKVHLALSLHAPTTKIRQQIVPTTRAFSIPKIMEAVEFYQQHSKNAVMVEYIMIHNVNSMISCADELGKLLEGRNMQVNLIPYNPTDAGSRYNYESPPDEDILAFQNIVGRYRNDRGEFIRAHVRWSTRGGQDIDASCGQLALKNLESQIADNKGEGSSSPDGCGGENGNAADIEDLGKVSSGYPLKSKKSQRSSRARNTDKESNGETKEKHDWLNYFDTRYVQKERMLGILIGACMVAGVVAMRNNRRIYR